MSDKKPLKIVWILFSCYIAVFLVFLFVIAVETGWLFPSSLLEKSPEFYSGSAHNSAFPPALFGFNIHFVVYIFWCFLVVIVYVYQKLMRKKQDKFGSLYNFAVFVWIVFFVAVIILSWAGQTELLVYRFLDFSGKTVEEKQELIFGNRYRFPIMIRRDFPGRYRADFLTDIDTSEDPGMFMHRAIAYFLYPIDIRGIRSPEKVEALILVDKHNVIGSIPDDFRSIFIYSNQCAVAFKGYRNADNFVIE